jgi:hypothetical protein
MKRSLTVVGATLAVLTAAPAALAQAAAKSDFGEQGQFIIGADRLLPFVGYSHYSYDLPTGAGITKNNLSYDQSSLSFFYGATPGVPGGLGGNGVALANYGANLAYAIPRVGLDYVLLPNVTIGGDIVLYFTLGGSASTEQDTSGGQTNTTSQGSPGTTLFGIAPRGGYILPLNDMFSLWLRGGFSYYTWTSKQTVSNGGNGITYTSSQNQPAIDLEPQIVFHIIPHVAFTGALTLDIPFAGGWSTSQQENGNTTTSSNSASILYFGLNLGMLAYF